MIKEGVYREMDDTTYHQQHEEGEHYFSSSQLKTMLEDPIRFKKEYIDGDKPGTPPALQDAFDVGTVVHTAILEPKLLKGSYVKWTTGGNRTGKVWDEFKKENEGKLILNPTMLKQATKAIKNIKNSPLCMDQFKEGEAEVSFFVEFMGLKVKVRTDWLGATSIDDLKTTTGNVRDVEKIKGKVKSLNYDLSAAFYVDVVNYCIDKFKLDRPKIETFKWIFTSKDKDSAQVYDGQAYLEIGRAKYKKAIELIHKHSANGWDFPEEIISIAPKSYEVQDWLGPKKEQQAEEEDLGDLL